MDQRIWDLYHIEVEHLCAMNKDGSKRTYEQMFYHIPVRRSQSLNVEREPVPSRRSAGLSCSAASVVSTPKESSVPPLDGGRREKSQDFHPAELDTTGVKSSKSLKAGSIKGFPLNTGVTYCQQLKIYVKTPRISSTDISLVSKAQDRQGYNPFSPERGIATREDRNIVEYLGIAADEPKRFGQLNDRKRAPLVEFGIDESLCGLYCQYNDMLSPSYETSFRDGCWFCHNQGINQLRLLRRNYPDLWALLMKWDLDSPVSFKADGHTVHDFDRRFQLEDEGRVPADRKFRWKMLEE